MAEPQGPSPEVRAKLMQLRAEFAQRAEIQRRLQLGQQNAEEAAKQNKLPLLGQANGGQIDMDRMRLELMNKGGLSKQERRANRKKFMEPSKDKRRFYHGSKEPNIVEFKTRKQIADENYPDDPSNDYRDERNAVFLSPDPKFTRHFSVEGYTDTGQAPTTYPVHVQARNPFDFDNPKHRENLWKTYHDIYYNPESELYAHGPHDTASEKTLAEMRMKKRIYESHKDENNWPLFENPNVQEAIQDMGHDSFYIKERGTKNLGVYDPRRIKSAIGNRGTYDINEPDINKAEGGEVDYRGEHTAPGPHYGAPLHDVSSNGMYPADFYGNNGRRYYANEGWDFDNDAYNKVTRVKNKPNAMVSIHRAVPTSVYKEALKKEAPLKHMIRKGDWVAINKEYARAHGESVLNGDYKIASMRVPAKHVWTNADSIHEWGYHPEEEKKANGGITHAHQLDIEERPL